MPPLVKMLTFAVTLLRGARTRRSRGPATDRPEPAGIRRIVFVKTTAWLLTRAEKLPFTIAGNPEPYPVDPQPSPSEPIRNLLAAIAPEAAPGRAWISVDRASYVPLGTAETQSTVARLASEVDAAWRDSRAWNHLTDDAQRRLSRLRHRIFLEPDRFEAVLDPESASRLTGLRLPRRGCFIVLETRFHFVFGQLRSHISVTVWSTPPQHREHRPNDLPAGGARGHQDVAGYRRLCETITQAAEKLLGSCGFVPVDRNAADGAAQGLPVFWIVEPSRTAADPFDYLEGEAANRLARTLLDVGHAQDNVVSHSVISGDLLTLRRPVPDPKAEHVTIPHYLMILGGHRPPGATGWEAAEKWIPGVIAQLTALEVRIANELLAIETDLKIWNNDLSVYNTVVERAVFLWDALSTHLPVRRGRRLSATHRAMELLHQMLLQSVGELGHIAAQIQKATASAAEISKELPASLGKITERYPSSQPGLGRALTETGLLGHVNREAGEIAAAAERVRRTYDDVLTAISRAFDERRARVFDSLQRSNFGLGVAVAMVALVTVLDATVEMDPQTKTEATIFGFDGCVSRAAVLSSWLLGAGLAFVAVLTFWTSRTLDRLGSRPFRELYKGSRRRRRLTRRLWLRNPDRVIENPTWLLPPRGIWQLLKDFSTRRLEHLAWHPEHARFSWESRDRQLAADFAAIWDEVSVLPGRLRDNRPGHDIQGLSRQIEQWGMHSLLLTERPRRMYRYPLPWLTCLFRCCHRIEDSMLRGLYRAGNVSMIATEDFDRSLARLGFRGEEIREIDNWLAGPSFRYRNAKQAWQAVRRLQLKPTMTFQERQVTLRVVRDDTVHERQTNKHPLTGRPPVG